MLKRCLYTHVHRSISHNNQDMGQPECPLADEWIKKGLVYTTEPQKGREILSFMTGQVSLDAVVFSETSQAQEDKHHVILLIRGSEKDDLIGMKRNGGQQKPEWVGAGEERRVGGQIGGMIPTFYLSTAGDYDQ